MIRVAFLIGASFLLMAADTPLRRPLDLPSGGSGAKEDSEDFPETIEFFGGEYEGDAFMFVIDVSGSMAASGRLESAQDELTHTLMNLSAEAEFGIVSFSHNLNEFSTAMVKATAPHKIAGFAWVMGLEPMGGTCIDLGTIHGLNILTTTLVPLASRRLILLGDGSQGCGIFGPEANEQALDNIMTANWERISIDTLFIGEIYESALWLFENIAQHNFGEFRMVQ
ncbi:VWA domain-containing protein [Planctomycetota bacterium]|nr:VWA domain-containing protein [Planctomycetota bacterium]